MRVSLGFQMPRASDSCENDVGEWRNHPVHGFMRAFIVAHTLILSTPGFIPRAPARTETNARHVYESYCRPWFTACWTLYNIGGLCVCTYRYAQPHTKRTVTTSQPRFSLFYLFTFFFIIIIYFSVRVIYGRTRYRDRSFFLFGFFLYTFARARDSAIPKHTSSRTRNTTLELFKKKNVVFFFWEIYFLFSSF